MLSAEGQQSYVCHSTRFCIMDCLLSLWIRVYQLYLYDFSVIGTGVWHVQYYGIMFYVITFGVSCGVRQDGVLFCLFMLTISSARYYYYWLSTHEAA